MCKRTIRAKSSNRRLRDAKSKRSVDKDLRMNYIVEGLKIAAGMIVVLVVIFGGLGILMVYSNEYHEATSRETKMVAQTCYTKVQGEWYPTNQVRAIQ